MKNKTRNATILGIVAGLFLIPVARAILRRSRETSSEEGYTGAPPNNLFSAYRGKFKPHRRKTTDNGVH